MAKNIEIGGRLHSIATNNVVTGANEVLDDTIGKKQNVINNEIYSLVDSINAQLETLSPDQQEALGVAEKANNNEAKLGYYTCGTEGNVAAKVIGDATGYVLSTGGSIKVKMTNANTVNNVTLNINLTGARALYYAGELASANNSWEAGDTVEVYFDGTSYYANSVAGGSGSGDGAFDVSVKYPTSGVEGGDTYTLEGALAVLDANLPASKKRGGMTIKFIQSPNNKYVQHRLMTTAWSTVVTDWQGVDDEPTAGSNNLVKSGGVHSRLATIEEELGIPVQTEITENVSVTWAGTGFIRTQAEGGSPEGTAKTWEGSQYSDFILIDKYTTLTYMRMKSTSASVLAGLSFYSEASESAVLVGKSIPYITNAEESGYENQTIIVPQNAKYIRFSCRDEYVGIFTCDGKYADYIYPDGLGKEVADLQQSFSAEVLRSTAKDTQLESSVNDLQTNVGGYTTEEITTPINVGAWRDNYVIYATTIPEHDIYLGQGHADTNNSATDFVDISSRPSGAQLQYTNILSTSTQSNIGNGLCFYDSQKVAISGVLFEGDAPDVSYKLIKIAIPVNAKYVRFSFRTNLLSNFSASFVSEDRVYINGLGKQVDNLSEEVEDIQNTIAPPAEIRITPSICRRRFYLAMTEWCKNHGINDAIIEGAGGFGAGGEVENEVLGHGLANLSVADMTKILYTAYNYPEIENVLAETKHIAYTNGNERAILLESSWMNSDSAKPLTDYYKVMFGKTGGGQAILGEEQIMPENSYCLSAICYHGDFDDCLVLGVVRVKSSSAAKFPVFKQLMDLAKKVINNDASASAIATELNNNADLGNAMAIKLPFGNPRAYHHIDFDSANLPYLIYKKEPQSPQDKLLYPMSMIKILTAMVVLDYMKDLDVFLTITQEDMDAATSYSSAYNLFEGGEKITIRDLLYASLLPSSNVANYVLARYVGQFLLETYNTNGFIPNN